MAFSDIFKQKSTLLKAAIFATGFSGVVAEYILSTLATYFLGDSIFHWIMIISLMLFSMGLGSRISKRFNQKLLHRFLLVEFALSLLVSFAPLMVYTSAAYTTAYETLIYVLAIGIGTLIGMELPLVVRINDEFETLQYNISGILENDYYGSLFGGIFFAFIGLPVLGLMYTPFILGMVNLTVALILIGVLWSLLQKKEQRLLVTLGSGIMLLLIVGLFVTKPIILFGEQTRYKDKVIYTEQSPYQRIVMTQWKNDYWLYLNGNQQLCTKDEIMYHEPLVHPPMQLHPHPQKILVLGGGDGCAVRELLKYPSVTSIDLVDLDSCVTNLGKSHPILTDLNHHSLLDEKVSIMNLDGFQFVQNTDNHYDVILIDLPDPRSVELGRLYSYEFYKSCYRLLRPQGILITQAGSPYFATRAFLCIDKTMAEAGFTTQKLHNQVLTLGEWGWVMGQKASPYSELKTPLEHLQFDNIQTSWINPEAMKLITSFGKDTYLWDKDTVEVNRIHNPVLYNYYNTGNWDLY